MIALLAQVVAPGRPWGFVEFAITLVVVLAVCGLVAIFARVSGVALPSWLWQVAGIVVAAVIVIWGILFVAGMGRL